VAEPEQAKVAVTKGFERAQPVERVERPPSGRRVCVRIGFAFRRSG